MSHHRPTSEGNTPHDRTDERIEASLGSHEELKTFVASLEGVGPEGTVSIRRVLAVCSATLDYVELLKMEKRRSWLTLGEARELTGRSAGYFENPQVRLEGKSRLQFWKEQKLADRPGGLERGIWLLHESVLGIEPVPGVEPVPEVESVSSDDKSIGNLTAYLTRGI